MRRRSIYKEHNILKYLHSAPIFVHSFNHQVSLFLLSLVRPFSLIQPDESFSDDFLFPMTSRLSYASSPESDGEFCDPETPRASRTHLSAASSSTHLPRSNSDPSLAQPEDEQKMSIGKPDQVDGSTIPDYNAPPPYAINTQRVSLQNSIV
jgi:hypothetical protein